MQARMNHPALVIPEARQALMKLHETTHVDGLSAVTRELVHLRASQINGCSACVDWGTCAIRKAGETDERLSSVAAWKEAPCFTDAERAALALTEAVTRLSDRADPVPDEVFDEAARHYDEPALAALILSITTTNVYNRLNVTTRQAAGSWE